MLLQRSLKIAAIALLAFGFALTAQAGPRLYDGTLIIQAFSNDTTDGTTGPFTYNTPFPVPFGANCNTRPFHAKETIVTGTYYNPGGTNGNYITFTLPTYGGQVATVHTSYSYSIVDGCGAPTYTYGVPLTGKGTISTTNTGVWPARPFSDPRGFHLNEGDLSIVTGGGSGPYAFPYLFGVTYAALRNADADFCAYCGPGRYSSSPKFVFTSTGGIGSIEIQPGAHKFGGTMRLLGTMYDIEGFQSPPYDTNLAKYTWLFDYIGGTGAANGTAISAPLYGSDYNYYTGIFYHYQGTTVVSAVALSWTTGLAKVTAVGGPFETVIVRKGSDGRDALGYGDIQMVSPMLTRWIWANGNYYSGGVGIMNIRIAPEPHEWMMLGAGISLLGLLYRSNRRSR